MLNLGSEFVTYLPVYGAALFLLLVGKAARCESRALALGLCCAILAPVPVSLVVAGVLALGARFVDLIHIR